MTFIAEPRGERNSGKLYDVIEAQLSEALFHLPETQVRHIVIAYEPVWAIGTGKVASSEEASFAHLFCREVIAEKWGSIASRNSAAEPRPTSNVSWVMRPLAKP